MGIWGRGGVCEPKIRYSTGANGDLGSWWCVKRQRNEFVWFLYIFVGKKDKNTRSKK